MLSHENMTPLFFTVQSEKDSLTNKTYMLINIKIDIYAFTWKEKDSYICQGINRRVKTVVDVVHTKLTLAWLTSDFVLKMATQSRDINTNGFTVNLKY